MKKDIIRLSKEMLICYLLNELGNNGTWEVVTYLTDDGCWTGALDIRFAKEGLGNDDIVYIKALATRN